MATPPPEQGLTVVQASTPRKYTLLSRVLEASKLMNGGSPLSDETIWKRLQEAGFDEESIKRRDKAALIAYITRLETEIYDYQHNLGLLLLEKKEWTAKYEQAKMSAESAEAMHKLDQASHLAALSESRKREENLKKALGVEKLCVTNIEKALHETRAEAAEAKVASDSKLAEARAMMEDAQQKITEANAKLLAAESLQAESSRYHSIAERKLHEIEAREDALRRRLQSFKSECDAKEKEISLERQLLFDDKKSLNQGKERLLEGQSLLNQREEYLLDRSKKLSSLEKELEAEKVKVDDAHKAFLEEKSSFELKTVSLTSREEAVIKREGLLDKKEQELLVLQGKIVCKEIDELQRLSAEHDALMERRKSEFEAEMKLKRKLVEDELETSRKSCQLREVELNTKEEELQKKANDIELLSSSLSDKEKEIAGIVKSFDEKQMSLKALEKEVEVQKNSLLKEREELSIMKLDLRKWKSSLEDEKQHVHERLDITQSERNELLNLQTKLKDEIDSFRVQKAELMAEVDELKAEKEKFENEWQLIDVKREELKKEAAHVAEQRKAVSQFLKDEKRNLMLEKDALRDQFKKNAETLSLERENFMSRIELEHSEWFNKIQNERVEFLRGVDLQKNELERSIIKRREEVEQYLKEKEEEFEQEKVKDLQYISSQKEFIARELDVVATEMKKLENERAEIALDRLQREREWAEIKKFIEELEIQRSKLQKQRESLHAERTDILVQIEQLKQLGDLKFNDSDDQKDGEANKEEPLTCKALTAQMIVHDSVHRTNVSAEVVDSNPRQKLLFLQSSNDTSFVSSPLSWVKKCRELVFNSSPEKDADGINLNRMGMKKIVSSPLTSSKDSKLEKPTSKGKGVQKERIFVGTQPPMSSLEESKVIFEVPSFAKNQDNANILNSEPNINKRKVFQHNESFVQNGNEEKTLSTDSGKNTPSVGGKRQKRFSTHHSIEISDQQYATIENHGDASKVEKENISNCNASMKVLSSSNNNYPQTIKRAVMDGEVTYSRANNDHEISEPPVTNYNENEQEILICSQNSNSELEQDLRVGGSDPDGNQLQHVQNDLLSLRSNEQVQPKSHLRALQKVCLEVDKDSLSKLSEFVGEGMAESCHEVEHLSEFNNDSSDGEDEDKEESVTVKEKLWNFLIT